MKLLLLGNWHSLSNADQYARAFRRLGHEVVTCGPRFTGWDAGEWRRGLQEMEWPPTDDEADAYAAQVLADSPRPDIETASGADLGMVDDVLALAPYDAVLTFDAHGDNPRLVEAPGVPTALIVGDSHTLDPKSVRAHEYDHLFIQFRRADLAAFDHPSKHWLPAAADSSIWVHVPDMPKEYDVLFVGSTHPQVHKERVELIRFLKRELGEERVAVKHLFGERAALAMNRARVVLNRSLAGDLNMRTVEALCTGACLVTDAVDGLGEMAGTYSFAVDEGPEMWAKVITELLRSPNVGIATGAGGRRTVLERHTYEHRCRQILDVLFSPQAAKSKPKPSARSLFPVSKAPRASVIIPVLNHWADLTVPLLERLWDQLGDSGEHEVIVVNDGSTDQTPRAGVHANARIVYQENAGFAAACNTGAREARGDVLVFLNNDTEPQEGWLAPLLRVLDEGDVGAGIAGPLLTFPDGSVQAAGLKRGVLGTWWNKRERPVAQRAEDALTGACLAIKRDTFWRLGGFDEGYAGGGGCEDVDLCLRAGAQDLLVVLVPESVVIHKEGSTRALLPETADTIARNQERLRERWGPRPVPDLPPHPGPAAPTVLPTLIPSWRTGTPRGNATVVEWDGPDDVQQAGSLAAINRALWVRLPEQLAGTELGSIRISHRWTGVDRAWEPPGAGVDHWCIIVPWEGMAPVPVAWREAWRHPKLRAVFTPSEHSRRFLVESGLHPEKVRVVPNGVDLDVFKPEGDRLTAAPGVFRALFVGGLTWRKGIDLLYEAWRRAFTPDEPVRLVLKAAGTRTFYRDSTLQPPADLPNVQLLDQDDLTPEQMAKLYRSCDVLVLPSRGEAFGLPVLEAMACGIPVIIPEGGPFDGFVPRGAGLRIPLEVEALARALRWCRVYPGQLRVMGDDGHKAAQAYSWDAIAAQYADVIREVCR